MKKPKPYEVFFTYLNTEKHDVFEYLDCDDDLCYVHISGEYSRASEDLKDFFHYIKQSPDSCYWLDEDAKEYFESLRTLECL